MSPPPRLLSAAEPSGFDWQKPVGNPSAIGSVPPVGLGGVTPRWFLYPPRRGRLTPSRPCVCVCEFDGAGGLVIHTCDHLERQAAWRLIWSGGAHILTLSPVVRVSICLSAADVRLEGGVFKLPALNRADPRSTQAEWAKPALILAKD